MKNHLRDPKRILALVTVGLGLVVFVILRLLLGWPWCWAWWAGFSLVTFLAYGFDKLQAGKPDIQRVPELVLHLLAFAGGVAGAWAGRLVFRHKTRRLGFTIVLSLASVLHLGWWWLIVQNGSPWTTE